MKNMPNSVDRMKNFKTFKLYNKINRKSISKYKITHTEAKKKKRIIEDAFFNDVGVDLFSREAALQVFSARVSLTTVFGMGTGGPSA